MKRPFRVVIGQILQAAAFGRLCVETIAYIVTILDSSVAAFGRLCVETKEAGQGSDTNLAAAFGRLCVETGR